MKHPLHRKLKTRLLAALLALAQCLSLSGCILDNVSADLPMAPTVAVPMVDTSKTVSTETIKKFNIAGKDAFYLLPGTESDPDKMIDFRCFDYTSQGEFIYMYSAPAYIEPADVSKLKGTTGKAPETGTALPVRDNGATCDALIVMTYNPYTRDYRVLDAQVYTRGDTDTKISEAEYFKADGYYMLANAYGGKLGEEEKYFVLDRAGTVKVYDVKGEIVLESAFSALLKAEIDQLIAFYYLDENGKKKPKKKDDDSSGGGNDEIKEAQEEVQNETGESSSKDKPTENFAISEHAKTAEAGVLLKGAAMDSNDMMYCSVMIYDNGSPFDPESEVHEEVINCYAIDLDSADVEYLSYNRNWPKQQAEWMKLDDKTLKLRIADDDDTMAGAINTIQKAGLGRGITMGELLGNDLKTLQRMFGMDAIKSSGTYSRREYEVKNFIAQQMLGIELADVPDDYSPFMMGADTGFPSFIAGRMDISNDLGMIEQISARQNLGYELTKEEYTFLQFMDVDHEVMNENLNYYFKYYSWGTKSLNRETAEGILNGLKGYWNILHYTTDKSRIREQMNYYIWRRLFEDIGDFNATVGNKNITDMPALFKHLWTGGTVNMKTTMYGRNFFWFLKLGSFKKTTNTVTLKNGFSNNWKRSYYAGAYNYFRENMQSLPTGGDYSQWENIQTGTGYDKLADPRLYCRMESLENSRMTPKPGMWVTSSKTNVSPFNNNYIEMLYAYHESPFKGSVQETPAMIYEVPAKAPGQGKGVYGASSMEAVEWNQEMKRTIHVDFSEDLDYAQAKTVNLPGFTPSGTAYTKGKTAQKTTYLDTDTHWRDALTVYVRDSLAHQSRKLYDDLTGAMQEKQLLHMAGVQAALDEVYRDYETETEITLPVEVLDEIYNAGTVDWEGEVTKETVPYTSIGRNAGTKMVNNKDVKALPYKDVVLDMPVENINASVEVRGDQKTVTVWYKDKELKVPVNKLTKYMTEDVYDYNKWKWVKLIDTKKTATVKIRVQAPTPFKYHLRDIYRALYEVAENRQEISTYWVDYQKAISGGEYTWDFWNKYSYAGNWYQRAVENCYNPIDDLSDQQQLGYQDFRDACEKYGVSDFFTVMRPAGMTEKNELYAGITREEIRYDAVYARKETVTYRFYYDEDEWWDVDDNWASFVQDWVENTGRYTDEEIAAILDVHRGLIHVKETIPAHTIPTIYRMNFPEGSTACYASVSEQSGTATAAPNEGVILYYETTQTSSSDSTDIKHYSNINYVYPRTLNTNSPSDLMNLLTQYGFTNSNGLVDTNVPGAAMDAGYISYRDDGGNLSQLILLVTDQGVKFYPGIEAKAGSGGGAYFMYSPYIAKFVTNEEMLTSSGYTASMEQQTASSMEEMKEEEAPSNEDTTVLDEYGNFVQKTKETIEKAKSRLQGDNQDQKAGEKQSEMEYVQGVLNAARVGSVDSASSFTMTGPKEVLISTCDAGLTLFNIGTKSVIPVANGAYFRSYKVKSRKNANAETDAVLEEQADTKEQSYKIIGFNTDEYEYKSIDLARAKIYDLDLASGKLIAYTQAVKRDLAQRAIDYIRLPIRTKVDKEGKIVSIEMSEEEKKAYQDYKKLFDPNSNFGKWYTELRKIVKDVGLVSVSNDLAQYTRTLRKRVQDQSQAITAIYELLGVQEGDIKKDPAYWNNVKLRLSTVVETDALEQILVEIRMQKDVASHLDKETQARYNEYRKIFSISDEQGKVELQKVDDIIEENKDNLMENPTTNADVIMAGISANDGDVHGYLTDKIGPAAESERNLRGEYHNEVVEDIRVLMAVAHKLRKPENITTLRQKTLQESMQETPGDENSQTEKKGETKTGGNLNGEQKTEEEQPALTRTVVFTEEEEEDYKETIEKWLNELNPDNFREVTDQVLLEFVNVINMAGAKIDANDQTAVDERIKRVSERIVKVDSVAEIEGVIISEQVLLGTYSAYEEKFKEWDESSYKNRAERIAALKATDWYKLIMPVYQASAEVQEFLKQKDQTWEEYLKSVILRCGKGVVYGEDGKAEGATTDAEAAAKYYNEHGTMEGFTVTADIGTGTGEGFSNFDPSAAASNATTQQVEKVDPLGGLSFSEEGKTATTGSTAASTGSTGENTAANAGSTAANTGSTVAGTGSTAANNGSTSNKVRRSLR